EKMRILKLNPLGLVGVTAVPLEWSVSRGDYSFDYTGKHNYVVHVKALRRGDTIEIAKPCFKLAYLENAADRFRVDEGFRFLDDLKRLKELWEELEKRLAAGHWSLSQVYALQQELRRFDQDDAPSLWEQHARASLVNILDLGAADELLEKLLGAAGEGLLDLCLRWHLQVGKIKPGRN
ncbi:MAG: hypothetical protein IBX71_10910, partial [Candidatus Desulforudis sp.]|nr:hypothetical protein [Desulforudis sp.]